MTDLPRENVQSYPRPPALEPVPQRITIRLGGVIVADTSRGLRVLETHHAPTDYLPLEDIHATLRPAQGSSFCEWKGVAQYFDVLAGLATAPRAAWAYDHPTRALCGPCGPCSVLCSPDGRSLGRQSARHPAARQLLWRLGHAQSRRADQGCAGNAALVG